MPKLSPRSAASFGALLAFGLHLTTAACDNPARPDEPALWTAPTAGRSGAAAPQPSGRADARAQGAQEPAAESTPGAAPVTETRAAESGGGPQAGAPAEAAAAARTAPNHAMPTAGAPAWAAGGGGGPAANSGTDPAADRASPGAAGSAATSSGTAGSSADDSFGDDPFGGLDPAAPSPTDGTPNPNGPCKDLNLICFDIFDMFTLNPECTTCNNGMGCMDCVDFQAI